MRNRALVFGKVNVAFSRSVGTRGDHAHVHSRFDFGEQKLPIAEPRKSLGIPQQQAGFSAEYRYREGIPLVRAQIRDAVRDPRAVRCECRGKLRTYIVREL